MSSLKLLTIVKARCDSSEAIAEFSRSGYALVSTEPKNRRPPHRAALFNLLFLTP